MKVLPGFPQDQQGSLADLGEGIQKGNLLSALISQ